MSQRIRVVDCSEGNAGVHNPRCLVIVSVLDRTVVNSFSCIAYVILEERTSIMTFSSLNETNRAYSWNVKVSCTSRTVISAPLTNFVPKRELYQHNAGSLRRTGSEKRISLRQESEEERATTDCDSPSLGHSFTILLCLLQQRFFACFQLDLSILSTVNSSSHRLLVNR
jgi:hypothetical protein